MICVIALLLIAADDSKEGVRLPTLEPDSAFEGRWELISIHRGHDPMESAERTLVVIAGTWGEEAKDDGQTTRWKVRRTAARPLHGIDVTIIHTNGITEGPVRSGTMMMSRRRGVYRLAGDTLTIVYGPWKGPTPNSLDRAPGRLVEVWRRIPPEE